MAQVKRPPSKIPVFDSIEEEAEFWDTHDSAEFEDEFEPVDWTIGEVRSIFFSRVEFDRPTWERLRALARRRGVGVDDLTRGWVMEGLASADGEGGASG